MHKRVTREGFTLVELSLSLVFIAILSVAVVLVITSAISSYHRSITLNKVDMVGSSLMRDMSSSIKLASAKTLKTDCASRYVGNDNRISDCEEDSGSKFAYVVRKATVKVGNKEGRSMPVFGAFCTGSYSYIWNSGYFFDSTEYTVEDMDMAILQYKLNGVDKVETGFRLLKVQDESRDVCEIALASTGKYKDAEIGNAFRIDALVDEEPTEFLVDNDGNETNLALYTLTTALSEQLDIDKNAYYYTSFSLGTIQGGIDISAKGNFCAAPEGYNDIVENMDYCAINKFNFAALATGG